jgi:cysteine-rich repeat protein
MFPLAPVAALALAVPAFADIAPVGPEFQVNTYTSLLQSAYRQSVCRGDAGSFVIAFRGVDFNNGGGIFARRYASDGTAQGTEFRLNAYTTGNQEFAAAACAPNGDFVVVWRSFTQDGDDYAAIGRRFASDGTALGTEFRANTYTTGAQTLPRVALNDGGFLVLWESAAQDGDGFGLFGQRYASDGMPAGTEFRVNTYTTAGQNAPAAVATPDGGFLVVWASFGQDGSAQGIYAQRYASTGAPAGTEFRVNTYTTDAQMNPDITTGADGGFVVAWQSYGRDGAQDGIFAQRLASDGSPVGADFRLNAYTTADQTGVSVAAEGTGGFVAAWSSFGQDGHFSGVFARRFDANGAPRSGSEFRVNTYTTDSQREATVATDRDGDFVVAWQSNEQDGENTGVFAQRFADPCGDGAVGAGEACDDGSRVDGPCCSAACQHVAAGTACDSDGVDCTADACNGAGACGHTASDTGCPACRRCDATAGCIARARTDCRRPARARGASLQLTNKSPDAKDKLELLWQRGAATTPADFGGLPASPDYTLCLFDQSGGAERLALDAVIPAGSGWKRRGAKGFRYRSRSGAPDGVTSVVLQSGAAGKAKAIVAGKGAALGLPPFPLAPPVRAQLQAGGNDGVCFAADFAAPKKNTASTFKAKGE